MSGVHSDFATLMVGLAEAYRVKLTATQIQMYAGGLQDVDFQTVKAAAHRALRECTFFPTVAELRRFSGEPSPDDAGYLAWVGLCRAAETVGAYSSLDIEDVAAARAVQRVFGGWPAFCAECVEPATPAWLGRRTEFLAVYREERRSRLPAGLVRLPGACAVDGQEAVGVNTWAGLLSRDGSVGTRRQLPSADTPLIELTGAPDGPERETGRRGETS